MAEVTFESQPVLTEQEAELVDTLDVEQIVQDYLDTNGLEMNAGQLIDAYVLGYETEN